MCVRENFFEKNSLNTLDLVRFTSFTKDSQMLGSMRCLKPLHVVHLQGLIHPYPSSRYAMHPLASQIIVLFPVKLQSSFSLVPPFDRIPLRSASGPASAIPYSEVFFPQ